jgi:hypothetical protein
METLDTLLLLTATSTPTTTKGEGIVVFPYTGLPFSQKPQLQMKVTHGLVLKCW